jgi:hypothetical protein
MCWDVHPDPDLDLLPIADPGSSGQKGTGSRFRIRNIGFANYRMRMLMALLGDTRCSRDCLLLPAGLSLRCPGPPERLPSPQGNKTCEAKRSRGVKGDIVIFVLLCGVSVLWIRNDLAGSGSYFTGRPGSGS